MSVTLLTEHHLEFSKLKRRLSLVMSKCHIVGNHMSRLISKSRKSVPDQGKEMDCLCVVDQGCAS